MSLSDKHQRFVDEYCVDQDTAKAYRRAYPNCKNDLSAGAAGRRLLRNVTICSAIEAKLAEQNKAVEAKVVETKEQIAAKAVIDAAWVQDALVRNLQRAMQEVPVLDKEGNPTGEYRYDGNVANKAAELIGKLKMVKAFEDKVKVEHTGKDGGPIENKTTVIDARKKILSYAEELRQAVERDIYESSEHAANPHLNGHLSNGNGHANGTS